MPFLLRRRWLLLVAALLAGSILYFAGLTRTGTIDPDEPRYASIGREMARSGDWITPRLWGQPWFEKPALSYWMTGLGYSLGLPDDLAPRLPVALAAAAFLVFFWHAVRRDYQERVAWYATAILGTSAGWLAFSHIAVTDMPMAACLGGCLLLVMQGRRPIMAGVLLGLALLAKGLVPYVLFLPAVWYLRHRPWRLLGILAVSLAVAAPWYAAVIFRNGRPFIDEFFVKHHFGRFATGALQHVRPAWFYLPVLLGSVFPWTPLLALLAKKQLYRCAPERFLLAWFGFGFLFFSASRNKLPGYLLPLLPPLAILMALGLAQVGDSRPWLALSAAAIWLIPAIAAILPQALLDGLSHVALPASAWLLAPAVASAAVVWLLPRDWGLAALSGAMACFVGFIIVHTYPVLDGAVSPRSYWHTHVNSITCSDNGNRAWRYGLNYYAGKDVPNCNH